MRTGQLLISMSICLGLTIGTAASAQTLDGSPNCGERDELVERLEQMFGEVQKGAGLVTGAQLIEVWGSDETGTWTILMTHADGQSCVVAAGEAWRDGGPQLAAKGDPA